MRNILSILVCLAILSFAPTVYASSGYLASFVSAYPAADGTRIDQCIICHTSNGSSSRNSYGAAWRTASRSFTAIQNADSDGDGFTNLAEINALTFPGNAADKPAATGSLTVTILPAGAVTAGAQWRAGAGAYQNSGATVAGLAAGSVTVQYKVVAGWTAPADQSVTITSGGTAASTGTYTQIMVTVPNVVGQTQATASGMIAGANLVLGTVTQAYSATVPSGSVISQNPAANASVVPGTTVALVVSRGVQPVTVPNVVGQTQAAASSAIAGANLVVGAITQEYSATVPSGSVISQNPAASASVAPGTAVALVVSRGLQPVTVPNVVGQTQTGASTLITGANLAVGTITLEYSATVAAGLVIRQTPSGGVSVSPGTAVLLTVSKGVQPVITGSIIINRGARAASSTNVTLSLTWSPNAVRMRFSDNGANWTPWEPLRATRAYMLPAGDGYKTVRVQFLDIANNRSVVYSDYILLDTVPPTGSVLINNGATTTASLAVTLFLASSDLGSGVQSMRFSNDGANWTLWEPVAATRAYALPGPAGAYNTVRVQFRDGAGNYSAVGSDYIRTLPI